MLINVDKTIKSNLLQMYKREAEDYINSKKAAREKRIKEEREYLQQVSQRESADENKHRLEQLPKVLKEQEIHNEYHSMQKPKRFKSRIEEVRINQYGHNVTSLLPSFIDHKADNSSKSRMPQCLSSQNIISNKQIAPRDIDMIRKEDNMYHYLTDIPNENQLKEYFHNRRNKQINYYKQVLDAQRSKDEQITSIPSCAYIRNPIIIKQYKRYQLAKDPYNKRKSSNIGLSTMERNIILNPENNLGYNRYFNFIKKPGLSNQVIHNWNSYQVEKRTRQNQSCDNIDQRRSKAELFSQCIGPDYQYAPLQQSQRPHYLYDDRPRCDHDSTYYNPKYSHY